MGRDKKLVRLSKKLSFLLRHHPEAEDLELDAEGFTRETVNEVARALSVSPELVHRVVETDPKGRFTIQDGHIRANYGHSIEVGRTMLSGRSPDSLADVPPELFHGTAPRNVESIMEEGLRSKGRQMVHLSTSVQVARRVGSRYAASPWVLTIDVEEALNADVKMWKVARETVLSTDLPPICLSCDKW